MSDLKALLSKLNKSYGDGTIGFIKDMRHVDTARVPSGSLFLDWALGKNPATGDAGWPLGRIVELYGTPSSGKSLISLKTISEAQKLGMPCAYIDAENSFDPDFSGKLGVDVSKLILSQESVGETVIDVIGALLNAEAVKVVVVDSVASLISKTELEDPMEQQQMALSARMMSKGLRKLTTLNKDTLIIFINQIRVNPGNKYGNPEYTPGGKSLGFYSSIRVEVRQGDWMVDGATKTKIGQVVKFKVKKNKTAPPLRDGYFKFRYEGDIDRIDELVSLGILQGAITRKGAYFYIGDEGFLGREAMDSELRNKPELFEQARELVFGEKGVAEKGKEGR